MLVKVNGNVFAKTSVDDPTKIVFFATEEFLRFSMLSLVILLLMICFIYVTNTQA